MKDMPFDGSISTHRRSLLVGTLLAMTVLTGCAAYPFVGPTCGPGEDDIGTVAPNESGVDIKGEVTAIGESTFTLDDGTGTAQIMPVDSVPREVSDGDCVIARGETIEATTDNHDIGMVSQGLWKEEYVIEDE
ncbi:OB-fold nucleic acid binding domain-containing protein [Halorhabdus salina]|uniref:OB-fold nucleic acid binding domain-containing protein n=1 Tax=Halorhabdus salina TaxID=2750670 RepID=UPI0015EF612F|nr:OB-fold nucleic acid binding domain-containing protein [Halorhabdus salina]